MNRTLPLRTWVVEFYALGQKFYDHVEATTPEEALDKWFEWVFTNPLGGEEPRTHTFKRGKGAMRVRVEFIAGAEVFPK